MFLQTGLNLLITSSSGILKSANEKKPNIHEVGFFFFEVCLIIFFFLGFSFVNLLNKYGCPDYYTSRRVG